MIHIYIAVSESRKLIKIGRTSDYKQRRTMLRGELKAPDLAYAVLIESDEFAMNHDEWQLHLKFAPHFLNGNTREQFVLNAETQRVVAKFADLSANGKLSKEIKAFFWPPAEGEKQHIGKPMKPPKGERFSRKPKQTGYTTLRIKLPDQLHARLKVQAAMTNSSMQELAVAGIKAVCPFPYENGSQIPALASANPQKRGM